jgi:hypothetical protein
MKTHFALFSLIFGCAMLSFGQRPIEAPETFQRGVTANAVSITLAGQQKNVEKVVDDKFQAGTGKKSKPYKGLIFFSGVRYPALSPATLDIYFRVDKPSRNEDNLSKVVVFLSSGQENFISSNTHAEEIENLEAILDELPFEVRKYELQLAIEEQQKVIDRDIREHERMVKDSVALQKTLADTYKAIDENKTSRSNQLKKIDEGKVKKAELEKALKEMDEEVWQPEKKADPANKED